MRISHPAFLISVIALALVMTTGWPVPAAAEPGQAARQLQNAFIEVAKALKPSVVNIRVERTESTPGLQGGSPFPKMPDGSPFGDLFEEFFKQIPRQRGPRGHRPRFRTEAAGSGVILDASGVILTNNHVVKGASTITVKLDTGRELEAKIIGQDPHTDIAVIKVESKTPLKPASFGDSDEVQAGQWCIAVGNPLGLEQTVTVGVVSAVGRSGIGASPIEDFIQTDASINPGNSGGPLVDLDGRVIGINTLIFAAPGSGIGFAIPSNMAKRVATQIVESGAVERPYIGISMQPVTAELAEHFGLKERQGAVVMDLASGSPGEKAGLKQMDIIQSIDGKPMTSTNDVQKYVLRQKVGGTVMVQVLRDGKPVTITVALERMPSTYGLRDPEDLSIRSSPDKETPHRKLGIHFQKLTPELAKELNINRSEGLLITQVDSDTPAEKAGLLPRDVILQVNNQPVDSEESLAMAMKATPSGKKSSVFVVQREGSPMFLVVPNP
jgi:serine protease Do